MERLLERQGATEPTARFRFTQKKCPNLHERLKRNRHSPFRCPQVAHFHYGRGVNCVCCILSNDNLHLERQSSLSFYMESAVYTRYKTRLNRICRSSGTRNSFHGSWLERVPNGGDIPSWIGTALHPHGHDKPPVSWSWSRIWVSAWLQTVDKIWLCASQDRHHHCAQGSSSSQ